MSFSRPIQWYQSLADPIWPDSTIKTTEIGVEMGWSKLCHSSSCYTSFSRV